MDYKKEGLKLLQEGDSAASTSLFKWKPDWDTAATSYEKAGQYFRNGKSLNDAINAFGKAATAYGNQNSFALAAKNAEEAGNICKDIGRIGEAVQWYEKGAEFLQKGGKFERASQLFVKAANCLTGNEKDRAINLFKKALDLYSTNDSFHHAMDVYRSFNAFLVKEKFYEEAIQNIEKQILGFIQLKQDQGKHKSILSLIILRLKTGDWVKATEVQEKYSQDGSAYSNSDEYYCAQSLLDAFENNNEEELQKALKSQKIKLLENQIAKVGISLKLSDDTSSKEKKTKTKVIDQKKKELFGSDDDEKIEDSMDEPVEKKDDLLDDDNVQ